MNNILLNIFSIAVLATMIYLAFFDHPEKSHK